MKISFRTLAFFVAFLSPCALHAQSGAQPTPVGTKAPPPLGLLRLTDGTKPGEGAPLAAGKFSIDDLSPANAGGGGASKAKKNNADYIALDAGKQWSQSLRGPPKDPTFASFMVYGSQTTIIEVAGARLGVTASPTTGSLQLMFDDSTTGTLQWKPFNLHIVTAIYEGKILAALPVLTVALDPTAGVWHLYSGSRLLADHLPLITKEVYPPQAGNGRKFTVTAGKDGAWIAGLVLSDENPLYEDANFNGIDDAFEKQQLGGQLLPASASIPERQLLAKQWRDAQRTKPPPALHVNRPLPDTLNSGK